MIDVERSQTAIIGDAGDLWSTEAADTAITQQVSGVRQCLLPGKSCQEVEAMVETALVFGLEGVIAGGSRGNVVRSTAGKVRKRDVRSYGRAWRQNLRNVVGAGKGLDVAANRTDVARLDRVLGRQRILQHQVEPLGVGRLVVELHPAKLQAIPAYVRWSKADALQPVLQRAVRAIRKDRGSYTADSSVGRVLKRQNVFKRIVIAETRIAAAIFECAVEDPIAYPADEFRCYLIGSSYSRAEVGSLRYAEPGAIFVGIDQLNSVLRQV